MARTNRPKHTNRIARVTLAAGLVAASLLPASGAMAFTPMPDGPGGRLPIPVPTVPGLDLPDLPIHPGCLAAPCPSPDPDPEIPERPERPERPDPEIPPREVPAPDPEPEIPPVPERPAPETPGEDPGVGDTVVARPNFTG